MTPAITALVIAGVYIVSLRLAYRLGNARGFIDGIECMEEAECGRIVGTGSDQKDERKP